MGRKPKDFTGRKFGRLVAIEIVGKNKSGEYVWKCKCICGNSVDVSRAHLTRGDIKSCGCLRSENSKEFGKNIQKYTKDFLEKDTKEKGTRLSQINPTKKTLKNNTSGKTGVSFHKRINKWAAGIRFKGKRRHLGYFENKEDAIKARLQAEEKYFVPVLEKHKDVFEQ